MAKVPLDSSERLYRDVMLHPSLDPVVVFGSFETVNDADVINVRGEGFEVERVAEGKFTVTLANKYPGEMSVVGTFQAASDALADVVVSTTAYVPSTRSFNIFLSTAGVAGDNPGGRVNFMACFHLRDSLNVSRS